MVFVNVHIFASFNKTKDMLRQTKLEGSITVRVNGDIVKRKLRTRLVKTGGDLMSPKSAKTNKIVRCSAIADAMPETFMRMAEDAKRKESRAEAQRNERRAKRAK